MTSSAPTHTRTDMIRAKPNQSGRHMKINDDEYGDEYIFTSGRTMYAHRGIIGIAPDLKLSEGYDGSIDWPSYDWQRNQFTKEDMLELADEMIRRWVSFRGTLT